MPDDLDLRDVHGRHEPDPAFRLELRRQIQAVVAGDAHSIAPTDLHTDQEDLIMLTDTRTEHPDTPPRSRRWLLPAAAAVLALVAVVAVTTGGDDGDDNNIASSPVIFHDDFTDDAGPWESLFPGIRYEDGQQVWTITPPGQVEFLRPHIDEQRLVDMEVTAVVASTDPDSTVGVYCRKGIANQDFYYYFRVAPTGVVMGVLPPEDGTVGVVLAEDPSFARPTTPFEITARCVDEGGVAHLTMLIDGDVVLDATHDEPLPAGFGALEVQAGGPGSAESEVRWDEFTVAAR